MDLIFQNYHRHSTYTNPRVADCIVTNESYAKRAKELGHGIISSCEHGWQGRYIEAYELAQEYGLKFVMVAEAYWVKNRSDKDRSNCHIILAAKNENGRRAINDILSEANLTGFYGQPRVDEELILSLPSSDVIVTTACLAFWKYEDVDDFVLKMNEHFKENFFLEVQAHHTDRQRELNKHILELHYQYKIPLIAGCDSHYIYPEEAQDRDLYIESKRNSGKITNENEDGWFMDYPSGEELYNRFAAQGVLDNDEILEAINNTNVFLSVEDYDSRIFEKKVKMPTIYPELNQEEKNKVFKDLIFDKWNAYKSKVPKEKWEHYEEEINNEIQTVFDTNHADYFLLDYELVKRAKELGGKITLTGRGSGVSFFINCLLGFSKVDRISAPVKMFPERFMSATRINLTGSLADLDLNVADVVPFEKAQEEIMGNRHSYPMVAYGTQKELAAWKMYARAKHIDFEISNKVSEGIGKYNLAVKHADDDDKDLIDPAKYIPKEFVPYYEESKTYQSIIADWKKAPCSYLLYDGDIRREVGLIRAKDNICCIMDGHWAEKYKCLKNDILKVKVVDLIYRIYEKLGIAEPPSIDELRQLCPPNDKAWDMYKNGATLGLNQVEQVGTSARVGKYAPKNISELCAFVAAIRPGFKSMYKIFENREHFDYGIPSFDNLIQTPEMSSTFVLYQEMAMATLGYAGVPMSECYAVIKSIAKKRVQEVFKYHEQFLKGFSEKIIETEHTSQKESDEIAKKVWQILEDSSGYSFNASHSYCVAGDSLYCAYLKAHHPLEFYESFLQLLEEDGEKERMAAAKTEAKSYFKINFPRFQWGQDNRSIRADKDSFSINNSLTSIKEFGQKVADVIYDTYTSAPNSLSQIFCDLHKNGAGMTCVEKLIKIDYFSQFGNTPTVTRIYQLCELLKFGDAKTIKVEKLPSYCTGILKYSKNTTASGEPSSSYTFTNKEIEESKVQTRLLKSNITKYEKKYGENSAPEDMVQKYFAEVENRDTLCRKQVIKFLEDSESIILSAKIDDLPLRIKAQNQKDILGEVDFATRDPKDRRKLYVINVIPLVNATTKLPWAYKIQTQSIGSGKKSSLTVKIPLYNKDPIKTDDIIYLDEFSKKVSPKNNQTYFHIEDYHHIEL